MSRRHPLIEDEAEDQSEQSLYSFNSSQVPDSPGSLVDFMRSDAATPSLHQSICPSFSIDRRKTPPPASPPRRLNPYPHSKPPRIRRPPIAAESSTSTRSTLNRPDIHRPKRDLPVRKNAKTFKPQKPGRVNPPPSNTESTALVARTLLSCIECEYSTPCEVAYHTHLCSEQHFELIELNSSLAQPLTHYCTICKVRCDQAINFRRHIVGRKHIRKLRNFKGVN